MMGKTFDRQTCFSERRLKRTTWTSFVETPQNLAHAVSKRQILSPLAGVRRAEPHENTGGAGQPQCCGKRTPARVKASDVLARAPRFRSVIQDDGKTLQHKGANRSGANPRTFDNAVR